MKLVNVYQVFEGMEIEKKFLDYNRSYKDIESNGTDILIGQSSEISTVKEV